MGALTIISSKYQIVISREMRQQFNKNRAENYVHPIPEEHAPGDCSADQRRAGDV